MSFSIYLFVCWEFVRGLCLYKYIKVVVKNVRCSIVFDRKILEFRWRLVNFYCVIFDSNWKGGGRFERGYLRGVLGCKLKSRALKRMWGLFYLVKIICIFIICLFVYIKFLKWCIRNYNFVVFRVLRIFFMLNKCNCLFSWWKDWEFWLIVILSWCKVNKVLRFE